MFTNILNEKYNIDNKIIDFVNKSELEVSNQFSKIDETAEYNQYKVLNAMQKHRLSETHFYGSTGYGYGDTGREVTDLIYSEIFGSQDALVRHNFISGTHALTTALFGILRPNDTLLSVCGKPYDTLEEVIGISGEPGLGSLKDFGVNYKQVDLTENGQIDYKAIEQNLNKSVKLVTIQRSKGYSLRPSLDIDEIARLISFIKSIKPDTICMIDNCYGEFVEKMEPTEVGADICVGSLIKNPGGSIAQTGGYITGTKECVEKISYRLTSPGLGKEVGATFNFTRNILQGLFFAPMVVSQSLKGAVVTSKVFEKLGFEVFPKADDKRSDIIQSIKFCSSELLIEFCRGIQQASPVDSFVVPHPWDMPGYQHQVIMAAGAFTQGSSIELSADAPIKPPFVAYMQGGVTYSHVKLAVMIVLQNMFQKGFIKL